MVSGRRGRPDNGEVSHGGTQGTQGTAQEAVAHGEDKALLEKQWHNAVGLRWSRRAGIGPAEPLLEEQWHNTQWHIAYSLRPTASSPPAQ